MILKNAEKSSTFKLSKIFTEEGIKLNAHGLIFKMDFSYEQGYCYKKYGCNRNYESFPRK
jgi:hypothetical protein